LDSASGLGFGRRTVVGTEPLELDRSPQVKLPPEALTRAGGKKPRKNAKKSVKGIKKGSGDRRSKCRT